MSGKGVKIFGTTPASVLSQTIASLMVNNVSDEFNQSPDNLLKSNICNLAQGVWNWILIISLKKCIHIPCIEHALNHILGSMGLGNEF